MFEFLQMEQVDVEVLRDDTYDVDTIGDHEHQITYMTPFEDARTSGQRMHNKPFAEDKYPEEGTDFYRKRSYLSDDLALFKDNNYYHRPYPGKIYEEPHNAILESFEGSGSFVLGGVIGIVVAILIMIIIFVFVKKGFCESICKCKQNKHGGY